MAKTRQAFCAKIIAISIALALSAVSSAQQNSDSSSSQSPPHAQSGEPFTFKLNVNRVVVDVVVTDSNGRPVQGLTKQDFFLSEDEAPQDILSFDAHTLDSHPGYFSKLPALPPNTFVNIATEPERGPLYLLFLDLVNISEEDQPYARQQLLRFVQSKPEGTRFALFVLSDGLHLVQGFTADRNTLYTALDPAHSVPHVPRIFLLARNYGRGDALTITSAFKAIALFLEGLPGRKNIIWVSGLFPLDLFPHNDDRPDLRADSQEILDALARSESAIYTVDVAGVQVFPPGRQTGAAPGAGPASGPPGVVVSDTQTISSQMQIASTVGTPISENNNVQDVVATMTGGRSFYGRNDLAKMLEDATEEGSSYYTLTYAPSNKNFDGKLRKIRVNLSQKGYRLEYRRGYLATGPQSPILPRRYSNNMETVNLRPIGDSLLLTCSTVRPLRDSYISRRTSEL